MYSMMIIDDQKKTINSMINSFDWSQMDIEICGTAQNGVDALSFMKTKIPDIAIIDIEMPSMNGIELICEMRLLGYGTRIIVLTAHTDFEYIQQLIPYDISCYLLKTAYTDEIKKAICDVVAKLNEVKAKAITDEGMLKAIKSNMSILRERFIENLLLSPSAPDEQLAENIKFFELDLDENPRRVVIAEIQNRDTTNEPVLETQKLQLQILQDLLCALKITNTYTNFLNNSAVFITSITDYNHLTSILSPLLFSWQTNFNADVYIGVSSVADDLSALSRCYNEALECMNYKIGWISRTPIFFEDILYTQTYLPANSLYDRQALTRGIKSRDHEMILNCIDDFSARLSEYKYISNTLIKSVCIEIVYTSMSLVLQLGESIPPPYDDEHSIWSLHDRFHGTDYKRLFRNSVFPY